MFSSVEILADILEDPVFQEHASWKLGDQLVVQFLSLLGLDSAKFVACFPSQAKQHAAAAALNRHEQPAELASMRKTGLVVKEADLELLLTKLQELLVLSLHTK